MGKITTITLSTIILTIILISVVYGLNFPTIAHIFLAIIIGFSLYSTTKKDKKIILPISILATFFSTIIYVLFNIVKASSFGEAEALGNISNIINIFVIPNFGTIIIYLIGINIPSIYSLIFPKKQISPPVPKNL